MARPTVNKFLLQARNEVRQSAGMIIIAVLFVAVASIGASVLLSQRERQAQEAIAHTIGNERRISTLQSLLQDAEIGQRGYLITQDRAYLEPYEGSIQEIDRMMEELATGLSDNSRQDANVAVLRSLIVQKLSELRQSIDRQREGDAAGALAIMKTGQGKMLMDGVRNALKTMRAEESNQRMQRVAEARQAGARMEMVVFALSLLTAVFALVAVRATARRARSAELTRDELLSRLDRRLLAIMAADIVGYSRLMEGDETKTLVRLKIVRDRIDPIIEKHSGTIVTTAGDSVLAAFASALSAIDCAIEIQQAMAEANADLDENARLMFRIGINVGDVVVQDGDVFGDTVNVAARLETLAEPGAICISRTVRDHVRKQRPLTFDDLGFQRVKNIAQPISAFRVRAEAG
ncbi:MULTISPECIES: CHASE3 domain-containing protein [unclassified Rhizobium]|uniref:CHASE3 domain-containing protein n=1 Tax=unclassified Rhizobium TaxID=2613769 RepID=UPI000AF01498|nr:MULTISPECIES: CHASE3 domain-containing protein [unclassified Rhizobium]TCM54243.1 class 3 adenylate cyclase [Rhizobium sp. PP-F2F-G48]